MPDIINNQRNPNDNHNENHRKLIEMVENKTDHTKCEDNEDERQWNCISYTTCGNAKM